MEGLSSARAFIQYENDDEQRQGHTETYNNEEIKKNSSVTCLEIGQSLNHPPERGFML